jgi:hypothetical protein
MSFARVLAYVASLISIDGNNNANFTGNLGVGTSSVSAGNVLQVGGNMSVAGVTTFNNTTTFNADQTLQSSGSATLNFVNTTTPGIIGTATAKIVAKLFNSVGVQKPASLIQTYWTSPTTTTENGIIDIQTMQSGALNQRFYIGSGIASTAATGGDKGADSINVKSIWVDGTRIDNNLALLAGANTFTADQTIYVSGGGTLNIKNATAPGSDNTTIAAIRTYGQSSTSVQRNIGSIVGFMNSAANANEYGSLVFQTIQAGSNANRFAIANGMYSSNATGGDKGADTINAKGIYIDGVAVASTTFVAPLATTSGTTATISGIPSTAKKIRVWINQFSTNGSSLHLLQLGTAGGIVSTGYVGGSGEQGSGGYTQAGNTTNGIAISNNAASNSAKTGLITLEQVAANVWVASGNTYDSGTNRAGTAAATVTLSGALTQIRLTSSGADTLDGGSFSISYE